MVTPRQLSFRFKVSERLIQIKAKEIGILKTKGRYLFDKDQVKQIQHALKGQTKTNETKRIEDIETTISEVKKLVQHLENQIKELKQRQNKRSSIKDY